MAIIYTEDFGDGNSLFTSMYLYDRTSDGTDPLYPFINGAEGVTINGSGYLDHDPAYTGEFETYQQAGIWVKGPGALTGGGSGIYAGSGFWDGTRGWMEALYHPTTLSLTELTEPFVTAPMITIASPSGFTLLSVLAQLEDDLLVVNHENSGSHDFEVFLTGAPMPVAGQPYLVRMEWQCGTWDVDLSAALPDGFMRVWINDELIYEATNISLFVSDGTVPPNKIDSAQLGYYGLLGPLEYFTINDEAYVAASTIVFRSGGTSNPVAWMEITHREIP